jgi:hypothetical protein
MNAYFYNIETAIILALVHINIYYFNNNPYMNKNSSHTNAQKSTSNKMKILAK